MAGETKYYTLKRVAEALEMPKEILNFTFERYRDRDKLKENVDYILCNKEIAFTLSGIIWAVSRCDGNFRGILPLMNELSVDHEGERIREEYSKVVAELVNVQAALSLAQETVGSALTASEKVKPVIVPEQKEERRKYHYHNSSELPEPTEQEKIDTLDRFGLDRHTPITTFRTIQYNEKLRSIFEGMLVDYAA